MLLLVMSLFTAYAQETDTQEPSVKYKARTEIDFEGVEVEELKEKVKDYSLSSPSSSSNSSSES